MFSGDIYRKSLNIFYLLLQEGLDCAHIRQCGVHHLEALSKLKHHGRECLACFLCRGYGLSLHMHVYNQLEESLCQPTRRS